MNCYFALLFLTPSSRTKGLTCLAMSKYVLKNLKKLSFLIPLNKEMRFIFLIRQVLLGRDIDDPIVLSLEIARAKDPSVQNKG